MYLQTSYETHELGISLIPVLTDELCIPLLKNTLEPNRKLYILLPKIYFD